jgi:hypothetical protein
MRRWEIFCNFDQVPYSVFNCDSSHVTFVGIYFHVSYVAIDNLHSLLPVYHFRYRYFIIVLINYQSLTSNSFLFTNVAERGSCKRTLHLPLIIVSVETNNDSASGPSFNCGMPVVPYALTILYITIELSYWRESAHLSAPHRTATCNIFQLK